MKNKLIVLNTIILIAIAFNSCNKKEEGRFPLTPEERTISNYEESLRGASPELNMKFISMDIVDITVSDMIILGNEENFKHYESNNNNKEQIIIKHKPEKYSYRDLKEVIAKKVTCKYILRNNYDEIIERRYVLNKTGTKLIYENDHYIVNGN